MTPGLAGLLGAAVAAGYVPILRGQIRDGSVGIPMGGINPLRVSRDRQPCAFRVAAVAMSALLIAILLACMAVVVVWLVR